MLSYCTDYLATMPDISICMNCDTYLAINLKAFDLGNDDEFIFVIKNYNYIDSSYVFLHRARKSDMNSKGEIIIKVPAAASKRLKSGAFYNFAVLANAFDPARETAYKKLTDNGKVLIEYGAQDLIVEPSMKDFSFEIISLRLDPIDIFPSFGPTDIFNSIVGLRLEQLD